MINVALIGHGYWGLKLEKYIMENEDFNLECVCNSKSDLNGVWVDDDIDVVVIAVRNEQRYPITKQALLYGKDVLTEKPLALTLAEAKDLADLAKEYKLTLVADYTFTVSKSLQKAVRLVKRGVIGKLLGINMCVNHLGKFGGGSVYWILGSHMLSVLGMFVPLESLVYSRKDIVTYNNSVETGTIFLSNPLTEFRGQISLSLNYPCKQVEVVLYGSEGTIVYNPNDPKTLVTRAYKRETWVVGSELSGEYQTYFHDESNNLRYIIEYFHNVITGKAKSNIKTAVAITKILEDLSNENSYR